eukprot:1241701-Amphidinium_carterae.1
MKNPRNMFLNGSRLSRRALRVASCFGLCVNSVVGMLPRSGVVLVTNKVQKFGAKRNRFAGALPDRGMRTMMSVALA